MTGFFWLVARLVVCFMHFYVCACTAKKYIYRKTLLQKCNRKSLWELVTESHFNVFFLVLDI